MKIRSPFARSFRAQCFTSILIALATLGLSSCGQQYYKFPQYTYAGRPIPPSKLANRVMVSVTVNGAAGNLQILDALRDIRNNVQDTIRQFSISGYSSALPTLILNFPEQTRGYVYSDSDGSLTRINYSTEASANTVGTLPARSTSVAVATGFGAVYSAEETTGQLIILDNSTGGAYALNLPNVYRVAVNQGNTVVLAMVRNSNALYRVLKLNQNQANPPGAVDCQPYNLPVYCVVPVPGSYDRPIGAYFSLDGSTAYVLNCGRECGGAVSGVTLVQQAPLNINTIPSSLPYPSPQVAVIAVPGGVTTAVSDGSTLYLAGQQLQPSGLFAGFLSTLSLAGNTVTGQYSISDGNHTRMLFATTTPFGSALSSVPPESAPGSGRTTTASRASISAPSPRRSFPPTSSPAPPTPPSRSPTPTKTATPSIMAISPASAGSRTSTRSTPPTVARFTPSIPLTPPRSTTTTSPCREQRSTSPTWTRSPTPPTRPPHALPARR